MDHQGSPPTWVLKFTLMPEPSGPHHRPLLSTRETPPSAPVCPRPHTCHHLHLPTLSGLPLTSCWFLKISVGLPNWKKGGLGKEYPISVSHPKRLSPSQRQQQIQRVPGAQCLEQCQGTGLTRFPSPSQGGLSRRLSESAGQIALLKHFAEF